MKIPAQLLFLALLCFLVFFTNLGAFDADLMEARNFIAAREILDSGNWWFPTMNGEPRLAKPPFPTWVTAGFAAVGGLKSLTVMRLPGALIASLMVLFQFVLLRSMTKDRWTPVVGAAILATTHLVILMGRTNSWDIFSASLMLGAIAFFYRGWNKTGAAWHEFAGGGIFFGLSIFSKGPVGIFAQFLPFIGGFLLAFGGKSIKVHWRESLLAVGLILLISIPWPLSVWLEMQGEAEAMAARETNSWANRHARPWYFYGHFALFAGIWLVPFLASLCFPYARKRFESLKQYRFLLLWTVLSLVLLSVVPTKKERYLLPMLPPMALMITFFYQGLRQAFARQEAVKWDRLVLWLFSGIPAVLFIGTPVAVFVANDQLGAAIPMPLVLVLSIVFPIIGMALLYMSKKQALMRLWSLQVLAVSLICALILPFVANIYYPSPNYRGFQELQEMPELAELPFYSQGDLVMTNVWKAGKMVRNLGPLTPKHLNLLPFVYIAPKIDTARIPESIRKQVTIRDLGIFDHERKSSKHTHHVIVLEAK